MKTLWLFFAFSFLGLGNRHFLQNAILEGAVTGADDAPLPGARVAVYQENRLIGASETDQKGQYRLELAAGTYTVEFGKPGHTTLRIVAAPVGGEQPLALHAQLHALPGDLAESTAIGYSVFHRQQPRPLDKTALTDLIDVNYDTVITFDPETYEEVVAIVRSDAYTAEPVEDAAPPAPVRAVETAAPAAKAKGLRPDGEYKTRPTKTEATGVSDDINPYRGNLFLTKIDPEKPVAPPTEPEAPVLTAEPEMPKPEPAPRAGLLTAGEWNDLHNWNRHWVDLLQDGEIAAHQTAYQFFPKHRYSVLLQNEQDGPVVDAAVRLLDPAGAVLWETHTDNLGRAELWAGLYDASAAPAGLLLEASVDGQTYALGAAKPYAAGLNKHAIQRPCRAPRALDIVWAVDATGSMDDEMEFLKTELLDVIGRVKNNNPALDVRMGTAFYRDTEDDYLVRSSTLSADIGQTLAFIRRQSAVGGGDYPEAVHSALDEAIYRQPWSDDAVARICFLLLDASPHQKPEVIASMQKSVREAARRGIRIVPVTASGIEKDTEFLMKFFGLATNGAYVFLTDHSGVGNKHLEPTTDEYKVEALNNLLVRLITEYSTVETCEGKTVIHFEDMQTDGQKPVRDWKASFYPNPAATQFTLELPAGVQSVTLYDAEGRAVRKLENPAEGLNSVPVHDLAEGFYTIRILCEGQWQTGKVMVVRA